MCRQRERDTHTHTEKERQRKRQTDTLKGIEREQARDTDLEERNPNCLHDTPDQDDAPTYQVSFTDSDRSSGSLLIIFFEQK